MKTLSTRSFLRLSAAACMLTTVGVAAPTFAAAASDADKIGNADDIVVTATKVNGETPITASVHTFEPQAIVSRSIIENSIAPTADYSQVLVLTPGAALSPGTGNGVGLTDAKVTLRGFQDGQYNITYDGIPFGDSNDPTHHSTSYFPNGTYERIIVDRGPGAATDLGQSSYGGNVHIISREAKDKFFVEGQGVYGSFNTQLERLTFNSGSIAKLGGLKIIGAAEYKRTDGALTNYSGWWANGFIKAELPIGSRAKFSVLSNYNQSLFHQSDTSSGVTGAQLAAGFGNNFGLFTPAQAFAAGAIAARSDWNWQNKTTDMEIARLQWDVNSVISIDNKTYTYFYKNFTLSTISEPALCTAAITANGCTAANGLKSGNVANVNPITGVQTILGGVTVPGSAPILAGTASLLSPGTTVATGPLLQVNPSDIAGYTKLNQYRTSGNIFQVNLKTGLGLGKVGFWYEHSTSHRYGYGYDFTAAANANNGAIGDYNFNFAKMAAFYDYSEFRYDPTKLETSGTVVPQYLRYDEYTSWDQYQGYGEFAFKFLNDTLTITPGVKVQNFTRKINTPLAAQSTRVGIVTQESYKPTLPYLSVNYLIKPNFSLYGQFAKGFIVPSLGSSLETKGTTNQYVPLVPTPTKTTNYQAGLVYAGDRVNVDVDGYYIQASNSTTVDPTNSNTVIVNGNPATYEGAEGQVSYVLYRGLTGIANGTLMSAKDDVTHLWLTKAPNYTALLGLVYNTGALKLSMLQKFTGRQWADSANTVRLAPYSYGVFSGSYTFKNFSLGVTINNVFDDQAIVAQSGASPAAGAALSSVPNTAYIFQTRRSYEASFKVRF